ncbi:MAG TPA: hypothetical protein VIO61_16155 [Anaerolineaceae bacterium]
MGKRITVARIVFGLWLVALFITSCAPQPAAPLPTATKIPTDTPQPTITLTHTPSPEPTQTPTLTPTVTKTPEPTRTPTAEYKMYNWTDNQDLSNVKEYPVYANLDSITSGDLAKFIEGQGKFKYVSKEGRLLILVSNTNDSLNSAQITRVHPLGGNYKIIALSPDNKPWKVLQGIYVESIDSYVWVVQVANADGTNTVMFLGIPVEGYKANVPAWQNILKNISDQKEYLVPRYGIDVPKSREVGYFWMESFLKKIGYDNEVVNQLMDEWLRSLDKPKAPKQLSRMVLPFSVYWW